MLHRLYTSLVVLLSLIVGIHTVHGQDFVAEVSAGYASFNMVDMKAFQKQEASSAPGNAQIVASFPGYINYGHHFLFSHKKFFAGVGLGHTSTGGKISSRDYSGSYTNEQSVSMTYGDIKCGINIGSVKKVDVYLGMQTALYFNSLKLHSETIIGGQTRRSSSDSYTSESLGFNGFVEAQRKINRLFMKANVGIELNFTNDLTSDGTNDIRFNSSNPATLNPSGVRLNMGVGYVLARARRS